MSLQTNIKGELKIALKARDETKLRTVRSMLTAFTNELVATGKKPQEELGDAGVLSVIKRLAKQRKESIAAYDSAGRTDLSESEKAELEILESYLPEMMGEGAILEIATKKKAELGIIDKAKMGMLVGAIMKELAGKADGADVKRVVETLF
jgi:uncharacterized protein YqeY